ncbi:MAG: carboxypeptidase-like regulatory domain-containing protein [Lutimonas sp.]
MAAISWSGFCQFLFRMRLFICLIITGLFFSDRLHAQSVSGFVYDKNTRDPLVGASVYMDNSTIGTSTDFDGAFEIAIPEGIESSFVVSFVGYATLVRSKPDGSKTLKLYLEPDSNLLEEVVLSPDDDWPRELKLAEFKKHYLGTSLRGIRCTILNEDDLILTFSKKRKRLYARTKTPLLIENPQLQYLITADLRAFGLGYSKVSRNKKNLVSSGVIYKGSNRYRSLDSLNSPAVKQARQEAYFGSVLHFMRALRAKDLFSRGYRIKYQGKFIDPEAMISVIPQKGTDKVLVRFADIVQILYGGKELSVIEVVSSSFYIDSQGNHSPIDKVRFGGVMGDQRMGDALPNDYLLQPVPKN